ncbi:MAG: hypothetical protein LOY03_12880 [Cyclobacteriaceae bacterium]|jgi:hypothetical protein|nr:hypothetical protein [Cyclobacteriaceae bacterium]
MTTKNQTSTNPKKRNRLREFFELHEVFGYFFRGADASRPSNFNIRVMHGINKISIVVFLLGVMYLILKLVIQ